MSTLRNIKRYQQAVRQNNGVLQTDQLELVTKADDPTDANLTNGRMYYKTGTGFRAYAEGSWFTIPTSTSGGSGSSWDTLYLADKACTIDDTTLTWAGTHASNDVLTITNATGSGSCLQITNSGTGDDIQGTSDTWAVTAAGAAVFTAVTGCDTLTAAANLSIDATSTGTIGIGETSTGTVTITPALVAVASVTITGGADADKFVITAGDAKISAGQLTIIEDDTATFALNITSAGTTGGAIHATCNDLADGFMVTLDSDNEASFGTGGYFNCFDGAATVFSILANGAVTIAGHAGGTDALTITAGDIFLSDSDQNIIESENGTSTLLLLDNKAGAVGSGEAVLKVDAGGVVDTAGFGIHAQFTGAAAAGATVVGVVPDADSIGIFINGGGVDSYEALKVDADSTDHDIVLINSDGVLAADKGALQIVTTGAIAAGGTAMRFDITGTPNADARVLEFDLAGVTDDNEPYAVFIDAGGKKVRALHIDADPIANDVAYMHTDAALADNKAVLSLHDAGVPAAAGSNLLRVHFAGTDTNKHTLVEVIGAGKDCECLNMDSDPTTKDVAYFHTDAVIADNKAVLSLHSAGAMAAGSSILRLAQAGEPAGATSYTLEIDNTGSTTTNNAVGVRIDNHTSTGAVIQATSAGAAAPLLDLYSTHADAVGVVIKTTHTSATPGDNDVVCSFQMWGVDDGGSEEFGRIETMIVDATSATSASSMKFYIDVAGTVETALTLKTNYAIVGGGGDVGYVTSNGAYNLVLSTNEGTDSGTITITDGAAGAITLTPNGNGAVDLAGATLMSETTTSNGAGAVAVTGSIHEITTGAADALTLADGTEGQVLFIVMKSDGGDGTVTPTNLAGTKTTITFSDEFDSCTLLFTDGKWWVVGIYGAVVA